MKPIIFLLLLLQTGTHLFAADSLELASPNKNIRLTVYCGKKITYSVYLNNQPVLLPSSINLLVAGKKSLAENSRIISSKTESVDETIVSPVPEKRRLIRNHYNQLRIRFAQSYSLLFRVYDDGVAYRIITAFKDSVIINSEEALFTFSPNKKILLPVIQPGRQPDRYHTSFEELYQLKTIDSLTTETLAYSPVLVGAEGEVKVGITESDLEDYPGMFLSGTGSNSVQGVFAPYPLQTAMTDGEFPQQVVTQRANYIARIKGSSSLPWRVLMIAATDKELPGNDIVYRLAPASKLKDPSWVNPGKGTDEWIIGINLFNVDFKAGINTATYKYYINFAKQFGLQRIMMDAGWSNYKDLFDINSAINMDTLAAYAKSRGIKISMWTLCSTLDRQLDSALDQFNKWGVDFIMTDFMDRDDQPMVNFYHRIAEACADHKIMIMFHGAFPPKGFNRTWPNAVTREGVLGSEFNIWSDKPTPEHDVTLPFTRMLAGPMDYEPGILDNATKEQFRPIGKKVMSQGTRCHQLSMFVIYDSPMQIFSGNPSQAMMEPAFMDFLGELPTVWDETNILEAKVSDYLITARRKGDDWYIAGMTDWTARDIILNINFIDMGNYYDAVLCTDGINAINYPSDYTIQRFITQNNSKLNVNMAPGGGFVLKLLKRKN